MDQASISINGKGEVVGNLIAAKLWGKGIESFSYGEYFEAESLLKILDPIFEVKRQVWVDGVTYRDILLGGVSLVDKLVAHRDTLIYKVHNPSECTARVEFDGQLQVFSWFLSERRSKIAALADTKFECREGFLLGSYSDQGPFISIKSNREIGIKKIQDDCLNYGVSVSLAPGDDFIFVVAGHQLSIEECKKDAIAALSDPKSVEERKKREVSRLLIKTPEIDPLKKNYELLWRYVWYVILSNRVQVFNHPVLNRPFTVPSKFGLRHQWLWDSSFHAIVLSKYDVKMAEEEVLNLLNAQKPSGRIPMETFLSKEFCQLHWNVDDYSPWMTQPPVLAIAVEKIMERIVDREFIEKAYNSLDMYDRWFRRQRDMDGDQLMAYVDCLESGWDDSVRWDEPLTLFSENPERYREAYSQIRMQIKMAPVEAVDLNCLIYLQRKILFKIAEYLGLDSKAEEYRKLAEITSKRVRELMWDAETGFYYDIHETEHKIIRVKSPAAFLTLYSGIATQEQAEELVKHLFNPNEFWTTFPLPTVSADDPRYNPRGYWRGRSWINMVWFTYHGLRRYGFEREASSLAKKVVDLMAKGPTCSENYDSQTGEPLGVPDFGWSTLALNLLT
ncbi:MAG: trehalase family glycosidase [Nitrososphaerota archaeon]|nr:trehalase family glycosidase [Nitrososphaerota archaeon]